MPVVNLRSVIKLTKKQMAGYAERKMPQVYKASVMTDKERLLKLSRGILSGNPPQKDTGLPELSHLIGEKPGMEGINLEAKERLLRSGITPPQTSDYAVLKTKPVYPDGSPSPRGERDAIQRQMVMPRQEAQKEFYKNRETYVPTTRADETVGVRMARPGEVSHDWRTNSESGVVGPEFSSPERKVVYENQKIHPLGTTRDYHDYLRTIPVAEGLVDEEQGAQMWALMDRDTRTGEGLLGRSAGAKDWTLMRKKRASKLEKEAYKTGYDYYMAQFLAWKKNPKAYAKKKGYDRQARLLETMWSVYSEGMKDGVTR